jgi:pyridoxamine 5'-phosphate oxidase
VASHPYGGAELSGLRESALQELSLAADDRTHPFRTPVVSTLCSRFGVRSRIAVLRRVDLEVPTLWMHSDIRSGKIRGLRSEPCRSWCFHDTRASIQIRAETRVELHHQDSLAEEWWKSMHDGQKRLYCSAPAPGAPVPDPSKVARVEDGSRQFAVLRCVIRSMEWLYVGEGGQRRASFSMEEGGKSRWLVP